jgi:hypothetical protein
MPRYDFKCQECLEVTERLCASTVTTIICPLCKNDGGPFMPGVAVRQLSAPASIRMGDGSKARKAQRIKEPTWVYPDGHRESLNSANTRPEEP